MPEDQSQNEQLPDDIASEPVLWRRKEVADFFGGSIATAGKIIARPGFPKPFRAGGSLGHPRYFSDEVKDFSKRIRMR
jgi:predicted DNA-binding transcriptional regulator AlpA